MSRIVAQILEYHLRIPIANIAGPMTLEDLDLDSLDCLEICMDIEDKFGILILDSELEEVKTVQQLYDLVEKKQDEKQQHLTTKSIEKKEDAIPPEGHGSS